MKIRKDKIYVADIYICTNYIRDEIDMGLGGSIGEEHFEQKPEMNGERELLIDVSGGRYAAMVAFKDFQGVTGGLKYMKMLGYCKGLYDLSEETKQKYIIRFSPNGVGYRTYKNKKQLFPGDNTKISFEELEDLRIRVKYIPKDSKQIKSEYDGSESEK